MIFFADGILVGQANGKLIGISLTGKVAFEASISMPSGITEVERLNDVVGAPLVTSGVLCAASYQGRVTCMSAQNGSVRWTEKVDAVTGPTADLKTSTWWTRRARFTPIRLRRAANSGRTTP